MGSCYIHVNPRDAGMVRDAQTYRWSSARAYTGGHSDIPVSTDLILELCGGPKAYTEMLKDSKASLSSDKEHLPDASKIRELWTSGPRHFRDRVENLVERRVERRKLKRRPEGKPLEKIFEEVSQQTGVSYDEVIGPSRTRRVTAARSILCAVARREGIAATEIAGEIRKTRSAVVQLAARYETELAHRA